jgi:hypothetical protein
MNKRIYNPTCSVERRHKNGCRTPCCRFVAAWQRGARGFSRDDNSTAHVSAAPERDPRNRPPCTPPPRGGIMHPHSTPEYLEPTVQ